MTRFAFCANSPLCKNTRARVLVVGVVIVPSHNQATFTELDPIVASKFFAVDTVRIA